MADKYWVGGGTNTNWNSSPVTNWANTDGGAGNQTAPAAGDRAFFTGNSGTAAAVWNTAISLTGLDCTGSKNLVSHSSGITITITAGAVVLPDGVGGTYTAVSASSLFSVTNTSGTVTFKSNSKVIGALTQNGAGGTLQLSDALSVTAVNSSTFTFTNGTFDPNNKNVSAAIVSSNNSNTRIFSMGSGLWTIGVPVSQSQVTIWNFGVTGLTFNKNTANIVIGAAAQACYRIFGGALTYNDISIAASTYGGSVNFSTGATFAGFSFAAPNKILLPGSGSITCTSFTQTGAAASAPSLLISNAPGLPCSLSIASGSVALDWIALGDITASGGATFSATHVFGLGDYSGWTIGSLSADPTAAEIATAIWTDLLAGADFATAASIGKLLKDDVDAAITTRLAGASYAAPLDAAGTRAAVGLASANLDTQLAAIAGFIDTEVAAILALIDTEVAAIKAKADLIPGTQDGKTFAEIHLLMACALLGKVSGMDTNAPVFRALDDSKNRVSATTDADGNRSAVTLDAG